MFEIKHIKQKGSQMSGKTQLFLLNLGLLVLFLLSLTGTISCFLTVYDNVILHVLGGVTFAWLTLVILQLTYKLNNG